MSKDDQVRGADVSKDPNAPPPTDRTDEKKAASTKPVSRDEALKGSASTAAADETGGQLRSDNSDEEDESVERD